MVTVNAWIMVLGGIALTTLSVVCGWLLNQRRNSGLPSVMEDAKKPAAPITKTETIDTDLAVEEYEDQIEDNLSTVDGVVNDIVNFGRDGATGDAAD